LPYSSGTFSMLFDFDTEAASPPIEIAKLTETCNDIATGMSLAMLRDGTGLPTADQNLNGTKLLNAAAATTLTGYPRVTEVIDQDLCYFVDSGSANTLVITPSPAIAAYEEGQRFVVRAAANNSGATTLNVNGLGPIAVQTPDGVALASGAILLGGLYEFTYDANASPDRWVLTSPPSEIPEGMLPATVPLLTGSSLFLTGQILSVSNATAPRTRLIDSAGATDEKGWEWRNTTGTLALFTLDDSLAATSTVLSIARTGATPTTINFANGTLQYGSIEVGYRTAPSRNVTSTGNTAASDSGGTIRFTSGSGQTFTLDGDPANDAVVILVNSSGNSWTIAASGTLTFAGNTGSRTLPTGSMCAAIHASSGNWNIAGQLT